MTSVDIILPTRNRCDSLAQTLDFLASLNVQSFGEVRVIIVDNGSTDQTKSVVEASQVKYRIPQFIYLFESKPGRAAALNAGVRASTAEVLAFTDDDVAPHAGWLDELCLPIAEAKVDGQSGPLVADPSRVRPGVPDGTYDTVQFFGSNSGTGPDFVGANMALSRKIFDVGLIYDEELGAGASGYGEDTLLAQAARAKGFNLTWNPNLSLVHQFDTKRLERGHQIRACELKGETYALLEKRSGRVNRLKVFAAFLMYRHKLSTWRRRNQALIADFGISRSEARLIIKFAQYRQLLGRKS